LIDAQDVAVDAAEAHVFGEKGCASTGDGPRMEEASVWDEWPGAREGAGGAGRGRQAKGKIVLWLQRQEGCIEGEQKSVGASGSGCGAVVSRLHGGGAANRQADGGKLGASASNKPMLRNGTAEKKRLAMGDTRMAAEDACAVQGASLSSHDPRSWLRGAAGQDTSDGAGGKSAAALQRDGAGVGTPAGCGVGESAVTMGPVSVDEALKVLSEINLKSLRITYKWDASVRAYLGCNVMPCVVLVCARTLFMMSACKHKSVDVTAHVCVCVCVCVCV